MLRELGNCVGVAEDKLVYHWHHITYTPHQHTPHHITSTPPHHTTPHHTHINTTPHHINTQLNCVLMWCHGSRERDNSWRFECLTLRHSLWQKANARNVSYYLLHGVHYPRQHTVDTPFIQDVQMHYSWQMTDVQLKLENKWLIREWTILKCPHVSSHFRQRFGLDDPLFTGTKITADHSELARRWPTHLSISAWFIYNSTTDICNWSCITRAILNAFEHPIWILIDSWQ